MPGKRRGCHPHKALTDRFIRGNLEPGRYADGDGLYLIVDMSGNRRWMLRTWNKAKRKRCDLGLGGLSNVSLKQAREEAAKWKAISRSGTDPITKRRQQHRVRRRLRSCAEVPCAERPRWPVPIMTGVSDSLGPEERKRGYASRGAGFNLVTAIQLAGAGTAQGGEERG